MPHASPIPSSAETLPVERRDGARFALKLPATARFPGKPRLPVRVLDISREGCRLLTSTAWAPGTAFWLTISGVREPRFCNVMWSHERFAGIRFGTALPEPLFLALIADHAQLTERDTIELKALSQQCSALARRMGKQAAPLAELAADCQAEASAFDAAAERERLASVAARTESILNRLSINRAGA